MCSKQLRWSWPHHTTFVTANGHEVDLRQICARDVAAQAPVDSEMALWREWADTDERKELPLCPLAGTCDTGKQTSPTSTARGASNQGGSGCDTSGLVDARGSEQGGNRGTPVLSEVWSSCARLVAASIVGVSSLPRNPHRPSFDSSASGTDREWQQTQVGERPTARPC